MEGRRRKKKTGALPLLLILTCVGALIQDSPHIQPPSLPKVPGTLTEREGLLRFTAARLAVSLSVLETSCETLMGLKNIVDTDKIVNFVNNSTNILTNSELIYKAEVALSELVKLLMNYDLTDKCIKKIFNLENLSELQKTIVNNYHKLDKLQLLPTPARNRMKRGLVDVGGDVLRVVFGTATVKDVQALQSAVDDSLTAVEASTIRLTLSVQDVSRVVNATVQHVNRLDVALGLVSQRVHNVEEFMLLDRYLSILIDKVRMLSKDISHVKMVKTLVAQNILPHTLLNTREIKKIVDDGSKLFPNLQFIVDVNNTPVSEMIDFIRIENSHTDSDTVILIFPFVEKWENFVLYSLYPFPLIQKEKVIIPTYLPKYVAVNDEHFHEIKSLDHCTHNVRGSEYICEPQSTQTDTLSCAEFLFRNEPNTPTSPCVFYDAPTIFSVRTSQAWYIYFREPTFGQVMCPNSSKNSLKIFEGALRIVPPCSFSSLTFKLPKIIEAKSSFSRGDAREVPIPEANFNTTINWKPKPMDSLKYLGPQNLTVDHFQHFHVINKKHSFIGLVGIILIFLTMFLICVYLVCKIRKKIDILNQLERNPPQTITRSLSVMTFPPRHT